MNNRQIGMNIYAVFSLTAPVEFHLDQSWRLPETQTLTTAESHIKRVDDKIRRELWKIKHNKTNHTLLVALCVFSSSLCTVKYE